MQDTEKVKLLALFRNESFWCQEAEARNAVGEEVKLNDSCATAWDLTGGLCALFGWERACALYGQIAQHLRAQSDPGVRAEFEAMEAFAVLQEFNDRESTRFADVFSLLESMPVRAATFVPSMGSMRPEREAPKARIVEDEVGPV